MKKTVINKKVLMTPTPRMVIFFIVEKIKHLVKTFSTGQP